MSEPCWEKQKYHKAGFSPSNWHLESCSKQIFIVLSHDALAYFIIQQKLTDTVTKNLNIKKKKTTAEIRVEN